MLKHLDLERLNSIKKDIEDGIDKAHEAFALMNHFDNDTKNEIENTLRNFTQASIQMSDYVSQYLGSVQN